MLKESACHNRELNTRMLACKAGALTTVPARHTMMGSKFYCYGALSSVKLIIMAATVENWHRSRYLNTLKTNHITENASTGSPLFFAF